MRILGRCLCTLSFHDWHEETKGKQYQGHIYPTQFRTCKRCGKRETLKFNADLEDVVWDDSTNKDKL